MLIIKTEPKTNKAAAATVPDVVEAAALQRVMKLMANDWPSVVGREREKTPRLLVREWMRRRVGLGMGMGRCLQQGWGGERG